MAQLFNRAGMSSSTSGTGTLTLGSALGAVAVNTASWLSFTAAGVTDQTVVSYLILDSNGGWETGTGTFTASGTTLSRTPKFSSNSNAAINLSGTEQVFVTAMASDGGDVLGGATFPMRGFDTPVNLSLTASVNASLLTVNVVGNNGSNPTPTNPVFIPFRDPTAANGDPIWRAVTAVLSINTNSIGASIGSIANVAFRLWVVAFDNAGTVVLGLINCFSGTPITQIFPLNESAVASSTSMSGTATSSGVFYTPSGVNLVSRSFRILGSVEYNSTGLATPGTYSRAPDFMQLFGPGIKKPGDIVQVVSTSTTAAGTTSSPTFAALTNGQCQAISPTSAANIIRAFSTGTSSPSVNGTTCALQLARAAVLIGNPVLLSYSAANANSESVVLIAYDVPNTTSATTYGYQGKTASGVLSYPPVSSGVLLELQEIMG
jgi:hypothetical protein